MDNDVIDNLYAVTVVPGNGDGTFLVSGATPVLSNYQILSVIPGDYNVDGKQDLTLTSAGQVDSSGNPVPDYPGVLLLTGHGDFTFDPPVFVDAGHAATWGAYADFNADGYPDLVLSDVDSTASEPVSNLVTLMNNGEGKFSNAQEYYLYAFNPLWLQTYTSYAFAGDVNGDGSPDAILSGSFNSSVLLNLGGSSFTLSAASGQLVVGGSVTATATLQSTVGTSVPSGTVNFSIDGVSAGPGNLTNGVATYTFEQLTVGAHILTANYAGDSTHNPAQATTTINVLPVVPNFSISPAVSLVTVERGETAYLGVQISANGSFNGDVSVTCSSVFTGLVCAALPGTVTLTAGATRTVMLNVTAPRTVADNATPGRGNLGRLSLASLLLLLLPARRRFRKLPLLMFVVMLSGLGLMAGCSGGGSTSGPKPASASVTLTAVSGAITQTQTITISIPQ